MGFVYLSMEVAEWEKEIHIPLCSQMREMFILKEKRSRTNRVFEYWVLGSIIHLLIYFLTSLGYLWGALFVLYSIIALQNWRLLSLSLEKRPTQSTQNTLQVLQFLNSKSAAIYNLHKENRSYSQFLMKYIDDASYSDRRFIAIAFANLFFSQAHNFIIPRIWGSSYKFRLLAQQMKGKPTTSMQDAPPTTWTKYSC